MKPEEAIRRMECCRDFLANNYSDMGEPNVTAFNMAIKALEQEPILDKIRAEINSPNRGACDYFIVDRIEKIINKYTAEREGAK